MACEMDFFYGTSPPVLSSSPIYNACLQKYGMLNSNRYYTKPHSIRANNKTLKIGFVPSSGPKFRPPLKNNCHKKRVSFADDKGQQLTQIKLIYETYDCPPRWSPQFLDQVTKRTFMDAVPDSWEIMFPQPIGDYANFRKRLDQQNICLENLIVENEPQIIKGVLKVKNLAFEKTVTVRCTFDGWKSFEDTYCRFMRSEMATEDSFCFNIPIPPNRKVDSIEFCLRYGCCGEDFWDSNGGKNYILRMVSKDSPQKPAQVKKPSPILGGSKGSYLIALVPSAENRPDSPDSWARFY